MEIVSDPSQIVPPKSNTLTPLMTAKILDAWDSSKWLSIQDVGIKNGEVQFLVDSSVSSPFNLFDWFTSNGVKDINAINAYSLLKDSRDKHLLDTPKDANIEQSHSVSDAPDIVDDIPDSPKELASQTNDLQVVDTPLESDDLRTSFFDEDTGTDVPNPVISVKLEGFNGDNFEIFDGKPLLVGRSAGKVQVVLKDNHVSRVHAKLQVSDGKLVVSDVGSVNGTFINKERINSFKNYVVNDGDILSFWKYQYKVSYEN